MMTRETFVVGVDGGPDGLRAVDYAAHHADRDGLGLLLVHSCEYAGGLAPAWPGYDAEEFADFGRSALSDAQHRVRQQHPEVAVETRLASGHRAEALLEASKSAAFVVLGPHPAARERAFTGATTAAVASRARIPVISVPPGWSVGMESRRVVVGVDDSPRSQEALAFAFAEASRRGASLMAVRVWEIPTHWYSKIPTSRGETAEWFENARLALAEDLAGWADKYPEVIVARVVEQSIHAAEVLVGRSEGAGLVVVGARGRGGIPVMDMGSTARAVLAHATCPVAVVHSTDVDRQVGA